MSRLLEKTFKKIAKQENSPKTELISKIKALVIDLIFLIFLFPTAVQMVTSLNVFLFLIAVFGYMYLLSKFAVDLIILFTETVPEFIYFKKIQKTHD